MKNYPNCAAGPLAGRAGLENQTPCPPGAELLPVRSNHLPERLSPRPALARFLLIAALLCSWSPAKAQTITTSVVNFPITACTVTKGSGRMAVPIQRQTNVNSVVSVNLATTAGTAIDGTDYIGTNALLTFQAGETQRVVHIPILNDGTVADKKTFNLLLSNPTEGAIFGTRTNLKVTIANNNKGLHFYVPVVSINEDDGQVDIKVARGDYGDKRVSVDYATTNGTAIAGQDFTATAGTLTFDPGELIKTFTVPILHDTVPEPAKFFKVVLSNPTGGAVLSKPGMPTTMRVTINDTDQLVQFESANYNVQEESPFVQVVITRGENDSEAAVDLATSNVSAKAGRDYTGVTNTLRFAAGERRKWIQVPILNNILRDNSRTFGLKLSNPVGGAIVGTNGSALVAITDNDPGIGFATTLFSVANTALLTLPVWRGSDDRQSAFTVDFQTADDTARAGTDYQPTSGTLRFQAGESVQNIAIPILVNPAASGVKGFTVSLSNPSAGTTLRSAATKARVSILSRGGDYPVTPTMGANLRLKVENGVNILTWENEALLRHADQVTGPWEDLTGAGTPYANRPASPAGFYQTQSTRPTAVFVPSRYDGRTPFPLILVLHAGFSWSGQFRNMLEPLAESKGLLVCFPQGISPAKWNGFDFLNWPGSVDDSNYLRNVMEEIRRQFAVDPKRIYVIGNGAGGGMSHRLALDHSDLIAAIGSLSGATCYDPKDLHPSQPVNILQVHSSSDGIYPFYGGYKDEYDGGPITGECPGAVRTAQIWAALNGCQNPVVDSVPAMIAANTMESSVLRYTQCPPGGAVELWTIPVGDADLFDYVPIDFFQNLVDWLLAHPKP